MHKRNVNPSVPSFVHFSEMIAYGHGQDVGMQGVKNTFLLEFVHMLISYLCYNLFNNELKK